MMSDSGKQVVFPSKSLIERSTTLRFSLNQMHSGPEMSLMLAKVLEQMMLMT